MTTASFLVLAVAAALFAARLYIGPTLADRANALNGLLTAGAAAVVAHAVDTGSDVFLPVVVVLALVGFVGTAMIARYIEDRGRR
jgi:multicomponent Na+:H+ antiporter subunit F